MQLAHLIGCLCLALPLVGCNDSGASTSGEVSGGAKPSDPAPPVETPAKVKDPEDALESARRRWEMIEAQDWIQAYEFLSPKRKRLESLGNFIAGKEDYEYRNATKPALVGVEDDLLYLQITVIFTPHQAILDTVDIGPDSYTEPLDMIETWEWIDGKWYWSAVARQNEFLKEHPKFAK